MKKWLMCLLCLACVVSAEDYDFRERTRTFEKWKALYEITGKERATEKAKALAVANANDSARYQIMRPGVVGVEWLGIIEDMRVKKRWGADLIGLKTDMGHFIILVGSLEGSYFGRGLSICYFCSGLSMARIDGVNRYYEFKKIVR